MAIDQLIQRARSQIGLPTKYVLGGGHAGGDSCRDAAGACDCSGFICWVLQRRRRLDQPWAVKINGGWLNTDLWWYDAHHDEHLGAQCEPQAGALIVYPASWVDKRKIGPKIGHIGILTAPDRVIHCSGGNVRQTGDAIQETGLTVFQRVASTCFVLPVP